MTQFSFPIAHARFAGLLDACRMGAAPGDLAFLAAQPRDLADLSRARCKKSGCK